MDRLGLLLRDGSRVPPARNLEELDSEDQAQSGEIVAKGSYNRDIRTLQEGKPQYDGGILEEEEEDMVGVVD